MSLLAPLYALGALAIAVPIVLHLMRREPRERRPFSTLMFLPAARPELTRRKRPENLLLLLLRGILLALLAVAFARPLFTTEASRDAQLPARRIVLLVDTSASMRRADLWSQAQEHCQRVVADLSATDEVAVYVFDTSARPVLTFRAAGQLSPRRRAAAVSTALREVSPTWLETDLGQALMTAADVLQGAPDEVRGHAAQIVLISDLQQGSDRSKLRSYLWPQQIRLDVRRLQCADTTNARAEVLPPLSIDGVTDQQRVRVSVRNAGDSTGTQFRLRAMTTADELLDRWEHRLQVPPGTNRIVSLPRPPREAAALLLSGDAHSFDNRAYFLPHERQEQSLLFIGPTRNDPDASLLYYLSRINFDDVSRSVSIIAQPPTKSIDVLDSRSTPLTVVDSYLPITAARRLRQYVEAGGNALLVLCRTESPWQDSLATLRELTGVREWEVFDEEVEDYAMLGWVDFQNNLFAPFVEPQFNDFTKIRFWSHRRLRFPDDAPIHVIARFDNGAPALLEHAAGAGRLWIAAAGWQPAESQLSVSSKFVPLLVGMMDPRHDVPVATRRFDVGARVPLTRPSRVVMPDQQERDVNGPNLHLDQPGIYRIRDGLQPRTVVANVSPAESATASLESAALAQFGIPIGKLASAAEMRAERRRLQRWELEGQQKIWRLILIGALVVLAFEVLLASRLARRAAAEYSSRPNAWET